MKAAKKLYFFSVLATKRGGGVVRAWPLKKIPFFGKDLVAGPLKKDRNFLCGFPYYSRHVSQLCRYHEEK